jgi:hypothetical protein
MACLSIIRDGGPTTVAANPIFPLDPVIIRGGAEIRFEVFEVNAGELKSLVGAHRCFYIDETSGVFWARLNRLEPCVSTHLEGQAYASRCSCRRGRTSDAAVIP